MKRCELCTAAATMHCESDSANLCWDCDAKVHSANFLVEKHYRSLLCHVCQSPTAWSASGAKLGRTISVCENCFGSKVSEGESNRVDTEDDDYDNDDWSDDEEAFDSDSDYNSDNDDCVGDDEDEDNQVVPWTWPHLLPSSSSSGDESSMIRKRLRDDTSDDDDIGCSCSHHNIYSFSTRESQVDCVDSLSCLKHLGTRSDHVQCEPLDLGASSVVDSLKRLYEHNVISAVSRESPAVGSPTANSP